MANTKIILSRGVPVTIVSQVNATGAAAQEFCVPAIPGGPAKVQFVSAGSHSVLDGNIESTQDDGTTWNTFQAFDFIASPVINIEIPPGIGYRFNISNITGGPSDIIGSLR